MKLSQRSVRRYERNSGAASNFIDVPATSIPGT
jgi:hypothetical protein